MAPPVYGWGPRHPDPRCPGPRAQAPSHRGPRAAGRGSDAAHRAAAGDPLESAYHGRCARVESGVDSSDLACARAAAAPRPYLQAVDGPAVSRDAHRRRRALRGSARTGPGLLCRRKEPNPSVAAIAARPADETRPSRHHDPRLQAARDDDVVCRVECPRGHRHRLVSGAPSASGISQVLEPARTHKRRRTWLFTPSSTTTRRTSIRRFNGGSAGILGSICTLCPRAPPG